MRPIDLIREDPERVRAMLKARGSDAPLDRIVELDAKAKKLRSEVESLRGERNKASKGGPPTDEVKARMREVGDRIAGIEKELAVVESELGAAMLWIPNVIDSDVPIGTGELRMIHSRVSWMFLPVDRSITVSPPQRIAQSIFSTSSSIDELTAELPRLALIFTRKLRPMIIGSSSG